MAVEDEKERQGGRLEDRGERGQQRQRVGGAGRLRRTKNEEEEE